MRKPCWRAVALMLCLAAPAPAQILPATPIVFGDGRVTLGGDVAWSIAPDDAGFFNYTDYAHSALRMLRVAVMASVKAGDHVALLAEVRSENGGRPEPYGLYLRIRPWTARAFDIQIGRVPPTFGAFPRRAYAADNPLIGYPLAYQYLTSIRSDALPISTAELAGMRGRGWLSNFSVGNLSADRGVPLANAFRWDTGVQVHAGNDVIDATGSLTGGTLSNPRPRDDNGGRQVAGRVALHPVPGLIVGGSGARGAFVSQIAIRAALGETAVQDFTQTAWGADVEYSRDYYLLRFETVVSDWTLPLSSAVSRKLPLRAVAASVEGRYKLRPGWYVAGRLDHLGFSEIAISSISQTWDAPVTRTTLGGGYSIQRNLVVKGEFQLNVRDGGRVRSEPIGSAQLVYWF
ncbi:MAG: hypothetical protein ABI868_12270 [Acidobacteriota bacterium]